MAALRNSLLICSNFLSSSTKFAACELQQIRNKYVGRWMIRDIKRRKMAKDHAEERLRLLAMKRNNILPVEIREEINQQFDKINPRQTALRQLTPRCILTSRGHGVVHRWRLSRIVFRDLADYNKLSGVQRAIW
ncbi:mitochondrial ribosomal protein S14 [Bombus fervidus]|uniref:mitochondrial ribosomal protein S14 n=1 Tax=Bombus fervidus TaxID=203811 RepID=UPI003AB2BFDC